MADGRYDGAAECGALVVETDAADRPRPSVVAALPVRTSLVKVVVPPAQPACRGERAFNVQRRRHEVDHAARAAASGALLVVVVVAAAARAAAALEAVSELGIPIGGTARGSLAGSTMCMSLGLEAGGAGKRVAGAPRA